MSEEIKKEEKKRYVPTPPVNRAPRKDAFTKEDLLAKLQENNFGDGHLPKSRIWENFLVAMDSVAQLVQEGMKEGKKVSLAGLGTFSAKASERSAQAGKNKVMLKFKGSDHYTQALSEGTKIEPRGFREVRVPAEKPVKPVVKAVPKVNAKVAKPVNAGVTKEAPKVAPVVKSNVNAI